MTAEKLPHATPQPAERVPVERTVRRLYPLREATEDELLEELARRRNARQTTRVSKFCDTCANFATKVDADDSYNPCTKGHTMNFQMPEGYPDADDDWGFYRRVCADRQDLAKPDDA
jgi:hypothetical protein